MDVEKFVEDWLDANNYRNYEPRDIKFFSRMVQDAIVADRLELARIDAAATVPSTPERSK